MRSLLVKKPQVFSPGPVLVTQQGAERSFSHGTTVVNVAPGSTNAGNLILVVIQSILALTDIASVTDTGGNTYALLTNPKVAGFPNIGVWATTNATPASVSSVSITNTADNELIFLVLEIFGADNTAPIDAYAAATGAGLTASSGATSAPAAQSDLAFGSINWVDGSAGGGDSSKVFSPAGAGFAPSLLVQPAGAPIKMSSDYIPVVGVAQSFGSTLPGTAVSGWSAILAMIKSASTAPLASFGGDNCHLDPSGMWCSPASTKTCGWIPDNAVLSITGDIDLRAKMQLTTWSNIRDHTGIIEKRTSNSDTSDLVFDYALVHTSPGVYVFQMVWMNSANTLTVALGSVQVTAGAFPDDSTWWTRCVLDVDNGSGGWTAFFYVSADGTSWTLFDSVVNTTDGATDMRVTAGPLSIGSAGNDASGYANIGGYMKQAQVFNSAGTKVVDADFVAAAEAAHGDILEFRESASSLIVRVGATHRQIFR